MCILLLLPIRLRYKNISQKVLCFNFVTFCALPGSVICSVFDSYIRLYLPTGGSGNKPSFVRWLWRGCSSTRVFLLWHALGKWTFASHSIFRLPTFPPHRSNNWSLESHLRLGSSSQKCWWCAVSWKYCVLMHMTGSSRNKRFWYKCCNIQQVYLFH